MAYYLGIDGGGSKTACAIGDEKSQLASAISGPSNINRVGEAAVRESLHRAIREACAAAGIAPGDVRRACAGVAGAGREEIANLIRKIIAEMIPAEIQVAGDMPIALEAAFGAGPGVVVIAGTGSIIYGRDGHGKTARAGGWGHAVSDEGSAHWIGRTAVSRLLRAADVDGDEACSELLRQIMTAWKVESLAEIKRTANANPNFAVLFPAVVAAAEARDALAQAVLEQAGAEISQLAAIVVRRLFPGGAAAKLIPLAMAGGVMRHSTLVRSGFAEKIRSLDARIQLAAKIVDPVEGALQMARRG